jgi:hypothetical protein
LLYLHAFIEEEVFDLACCAEGGNDHDVIALDFFPGYELRAIGIHDEFDSTALQIVVYFLVVDHLAEEEHTLIGVFFEGAVADLDGIFHAVAKTEVAGDIEDHRAEVEYGRGEILLAQILYASRFLDLAGNR